MGWESLSSLVEALAQTWLAQWLGKSTFRVGLLLTLHLLGITTVIGSSVFLGLRMNGLVAREKPLASLYRDLAPVALVGLGLVVVSGGLIFTGGAVEYFETPWFRTKMQLLAMALLLQAIAWRLASASARRPVNSMGCRLAGALMMLGWLMVGVAGRAIAYF